MFTNLSIVIINSNLNHLTLVSEVSLTTKLSQNQIRFYCTFRFDRCITAHTKAISISRLQLQRFPATSKMMSSCKFIYYDVLRNYCSTKETRNMIKGFPFFPAKWLEESERVIMTFIYQSRKCNRTASRLLREPLPPLAVVNTSRGQKKYYQRF